MILNLSKKILLIILALFLVLPTSFVISEMTPEKERAELEKQLKELEELEKSISQDITRTQQEKDSLARQISTLKSKINQLDVQIQKSNLVIKDLGYQIEDTEQSIENLLFRIEVSKEKLSNILKELYEEDQKSLLEILLVEEDLSSFFDNITSLETLNQKNQEYLKDIKQLKNDLSEQKNILDEEKTDLESTVKIQIIQKQQSLNTQKEQEVLLQQTQGKEAEYQKMLQDTQKKAAEIRQRIFQLAGVADTDAPTFGEAYEIAKWIQGLTGVRPAFLLAVLQQESGIGRNVGQCYIKDPITANGVNIRTGATVRAVMKPMGLSGRKGDVDDFLVITKELGLDPFNTPVSCPIPSVGGYGGAMGPAQFIPTTWMGYRTRLAGILGRPVNPWNIQDAFLASAVYLSDYGAGNGTRQAEWCAAQGYFTGIRCNSNHAFYGNNVLAIADKFEKDIKTLESVK